MLINIYIYIYLEAIHMSACQHLHLHSAGNLDSSDRGKDARAFDPGRSCADRFQLPVSILVAEPQSGSAD